MIHVPPWDLESAWREITAYEEESRACNRAAMGQPDAWPFFAAGWSPVWVAGMLVAAYIWMGPYARGNILTGAAAMDTDRFFSGEWWRAVSALTVHAGPGHLAGNVVCLLLFGHAVGQAFGSGLSWVLIVGSAMLGNVAAGWLHGPGHVSVGASTACFGALGMLSAGQAIRNARRRGFSVNRWKGTWLPVGAGLALLTLLGTGDQSDLLAHLFGFLSGLALGGPAAWMVAPRISDGCRQALQLTALAVVLMALRLALVTAGVR